MNYLFDTNTIIDFTNNYLPLSARKQITTTRPSLSFITRIELFAWPSLSLDEETSLNQFVSRSTVYGIDERIILQTITIKKQYRIKLPDAIIAATALVHNLTLLSRNLKDFKNIGGLTIIDPHSL